MKSYSEIGNKIFNSKFENKLFCSDKIAIHKEIFNQLFFKLEDIDIDNIDNKYWLNCLKNCDIEPLADWNNSNIL